MVLLRAPLAFGSRFRPFWKKSSQWVLYTVLLSLLPIAFDYIIVYAKGNGSWPDFNDVIEHGELCLVATAMSFVAIGEMSGFRSEGGTGRVVLFWFCLLSAAASIGLYVIIKSIANANTVGSLSSISAILFLGTVFITTAAVAVAELPVMGEADA